ncbi:hypothetical protein ACP3TC_00770 [Winslowiella sp. 2C04]|uniref:hypothetical protein n=1 Tax=Winslowiella sp. 2C04 TaxID=3416179 RepID=UPI003CFA6173
MKDFNIVSTAFTMPNLLIINQQQTDVIQPVTQFISAVTNSPLLFTLPLSDEPLILCGQPVQPSCPAALPAAVVNVSNYSLVDERYVSQPSTSSAQSLTTLMPSVSKKKADGSKYYKMRKVFIEIKSDAMKFIKEYADDKTYGKMPKGTIIAGLAFNQGISIKDKNIQKKIRLWAFCTKQELKSGVDYIINESKSSAGRHFLSKLATISHQSRLVKVDVLTKKIDALSLVAKRTKPNVSGNQFISEKSINRFRATSTSENHLPVSQYELQLKTSEQNLRLTSNIISKISNLNKEERDALFCAMKAMASQETGKAVKISDVVRARLIELRLVESRFRSPVLTPVGEEVLTILIAAEQSVTPFGTRRSHRQAEGQIITSAGQLTRSELAYLLTNKVETDNVLQLANTELITRLIVQTPYFRSLSAYLVVANTQHEVIKVITCGAALTPEEALTSALPAAVIQQVTDSRYNAYVTYGDNVSVEILDGGGLRVSSEQLLATSPASSHSLVDAAAMALMGIAADTELGRGADPKQYCALLREQLFELVSQSGEADASAGYAEFPGIA